MTSTATNLRSPARRGRVAEQVRTWNFAAARTIPERPLVDIFPGIGEVRPRIDVSNRHHFELPYAERAVLAAIVAHVRARSVFEFGTYRGATTKLLARALDGDGEVHTIDLPRSPGVAASEDPIGTELGDPEPSWATIVQHRQDTATFDYEPYRGRFDLVVVDASHEYPDVLRDSRNALAIARAGGTVVWDDYAAGEPQVVAALDELHRTLPLVKVAWSRLVVLPASAPPG